MKKYFYFLSIILSFQTADGKELRLPEPVTNNAVAVATVDGHQQIFSFSGLASGKSWRDIHAKAFSVDLYSGHRKTLAPLPNALGRLASIAVTVNNRIYVIGGYTVASDHSEVSTAEIVEYLPKQDSYRLITKMPIPVDDTVALVYQQRYIYLISGWHDTDNIDAVQVYDVKKDHWFEASAFPGAPVFGHAGGIVGNQFLIADGVKVEKVVDGKNQYVPSNENWLAEINKNDPAIIHWEKIPHHPYMPLYRMAAAGVKAKNRIVFAGGSDNPYNFDGIGYNKIPSEASNKVFSFNLVNNRWETHQNLALPSMDHRGLLLADGALYMIGGMGAKQQVIDRIQKIPLTSLN